MTGAAAMIKAGFRTCLERRIDLSGNGASDSRRSGLKATKTAGRGLVCVEIEA